MRPYREPAEVEPEEDDEEPEPSRLARFWRWWWVNPDIEAIPLFSKFGLVALSLIVPIAILATNGDERRARERAAAPCSSFANDRLEDVPLRCIPPGCGR